MSWLRVLFQTSFAAACLVGCGFQPLHAPDRGASAAGLSNVRIAPISDRVGQQLHNLLRDKLTPLGPARDPRYELRVTLSESLQNLAVRKDDVATRANLVMRASFKLFRVRDKAELLSSNAISANSYNILRQEFGTLSAENNARERAIRELSDQIWTRVAVYLSRSR